MRCKDKRKVGNIIWKEWKVTVFCNRHSITDWWAGMRLQKNKLMMEKPKPNWDSQE
jgi:hypothetical protein